MWLFGCFLLLDDVVWEFWFFFGFNDLLLEVGFRLNFFILIFINIVLVCCVIGLGFVDCVEIIWCYWFLFVYFLLVEVEVIVLVILYDWMIEQYFFYFIQSFFFESMLEFFNGFINILGEGWFVLEKVNQEFGLVLDFWDLDFYIKCFQELQWNLSIVEVFDLVQFNSEYS